MTINELITALRRLKVETGSLACLGCGHEHNCDIHGCAIIREAAEKLGDFNAVFNEDTVVRLAGRCLKVEPVRLRELADADRDGRLVVLPCKVGDTVWITGSVRHLYSEKVRTFFCGNPSYDRGMADNSLQMIRTTGCDIPIRELGKTVFLNREEAEKALMEANEK